MNTLILEVLKIGKLLLSLLRGLLHITGVQIPAKIVRLPHSPPLGCANGAHVKVF